MIENRLFLFISLFFLTQFSAAGQDITGIWRGYFKTDGGDEYKYEVQLAQTKKNILTGITYSYLDTRFYGKAKFTGNYTKASKAALVQEIKTVELRMSGGSVACIMKCRLVYSRSGREEFLEGVYSSTYEKGEPLLGLPKGGECGGGKIFLRKVVTSEFYVEPFLRAKIATPRSQERTDEVAVAKAPVSQKTTKPTPKVTTPAKKETVAKPKERAEVVVPETKKPEDVSLGTKPVVTPKIPLPPVTTRERPNALMKTIAINSTEVQISLYDNGEIDDDTISIFHNGVLLLANKRLSNKPITFTLKVDEMNPEHTLVMVAENLGRIPPNTSLMIVQDGDKRHQVSITSTEQKNAMIRFRYEKGGTP